MTGRMDIGKINEEFRNFSISNITIDIDFEARLNDKFVDEMTNKSIKRQIRFHLERIEPKSTTIIFYILAGIIVGLILLLVIWFCLLRVNIAIEIIFSYIF